MTHCASPVQPNVGSPLPKIEDACSQILCSNLRHLKQTIFLLLYRSKTVESKRLQSRKEHVSYLQNIFSNFIPKQDCRIKTQKPTSSTQLTSSSPPPRSGPPSPCGTCRGWPTCPAPGPCNRRPRRGPTRTCASCSGNTEAGHSPGWVASYHVAA